MTPLTLRPSFTWGQITSDHGYPFYMDPVYIAQTYTTTELAAAATGGPIEIEAGSLLYGGLNDVFHDWRRPHRFHRTGTDVDIDTPGANDQRKLGLLRRAGEMAGFRACVVEPDASVDHVHCYGKIYREQR